MISKTNLLPTIILSLIAWPGFSQSPAKISEEEREILTYPFSDPNPVPINNAKTEKIYPYHLFEGYTKTGVKEKWKVVKLENDYIEVYILPEAGGKIWGAIEKSTGKEFIYRNEVMKFRNISLRGPWASGGIEFNFGVIGHTPATATPVDYVLRTQPDGSVSCTVGTMDLPSRTQWRVNITLQKDKAYIETRAFWNNPTSLPQSYYNWMTAAAVVSDDLEFFYPGTTALEHDGSPSPWPVDSAGRDLSKYPNNAFGEHRSTHIVGKYNDFMGGYYHRSKFGFGHWALYDDMPGHKLWLWALSRNGGIWEDLLTDTDGQYMEFQAGRTFNQFLPSRSKKTSLTQMPFAPLSTDQWTELWFPFKDIGGMKEVSPYGVLNVSRKNKTLTVGVSALAAVEASLQVNVNGKTVHTQKQKFKPMEVLQVTLPVDTTDEYEVSVKEMGLLHRSGQRDEVKRTFAVFDKSSKSSVETLYREGQESKEYRDYAAAKKKYLACLKIDSTHFDALTDLSELYIRNGLYDSALWYVNRVLRHDTYYPAANYIAGVAYQSIGDDVNALETFGWATRSAEFRSTAYAQMASIKIRQGDLMLAENYAQKALDYNRYNVKALHALSVIFRKSGDTSKAQKIIGEMDALDLLDHFMHYEKYLLDRSPKSEEQFASMIRNEFPYQTYLEVALEYLSMGLREEASGVLQKAPRHPLVLLWSAWLNKNTQALKEIEALSPAFVFPYRTETISVLEWAASQSNHWKFKHYLALNYFGVQRYAEAKKKMAACQTQPDYAPFYLTRARLLKDDSVSVLNDLQKANTLAPEEWRTWHDLVNYYESKFDHAKALALSKTASKKFKDNYTLGFQYARSLLNTGRYQECVNELKSLYILPFEGSTQGQVVYEQALLFLALDLIQHKNYKEALARIEESKLWPENLGVGKPYDTDTRVQEYLAAYCLRKLGRDKEAADLENKLVSDSQALYGEASPNNLLTLLIINRKQQTAEVQKWLKRSEKYGVTEPAHRWVIVTYRNDLKTASELERSFRQNKQYELIRKIYKL